MKYSQFVIGIGKFYRILLPVKHVTIVGGTHLIGIVKDISGTVLPVGYIYIDFTIH